MPMMIRKGLRARIKPALDLPGTEGGFRRVLPFKRSWLAIGILVVFDLIFLYPAITTFQQAASEWGKFDDLFDLVIALFLSAWLLGWVIAPLLMTSILAVLLFGREVVKAGPGYVEVFLGLPFVGVAVRYDISSMRNMRMEHPAPKSGKSWRGPHIAFDYGANEGAFGSDLGEFEVAEITSSIEMAGGRSIRRGDATEAELQEKWEPGVLGAAEEISEPSTDAASVAAEPVTLASLSTLALIIANLVPLAGAVFMGWKLSDVMVLYWAESAVIGFFNVCKIAIIGRWFALLAAPFFLGHFGAFMAVHFLFIYGIFVQGPQDTTGGDLTQVLQLFIDLWPALAILFLSHAVSFYQNFLGRAEYRAKTVQNQMSEPYSRIVFMHLVIIFGGGLSLILGEPTPVLLVVIVLKIWIDVMAHLKQRITKDS